MKEQHQFKATIQQANQGGAYVVVPINVEQVFGKKRVKVKASIDGEVYRGSLVRMGGQEHILGILKEIRQKIGKTYGDQVEIVLEDDSEPRQVQLAGDVQEALQHDPAAEKAFSLLSYTHQKEYVSWIEGAKREETRHKRLRKTIQMLSGQE
jgi:cell division ATPase FtsA